ncbi:MAG: choice-of-anchor B family protein [Rhodothermia bacterium]|nr:MAG: choice-of-anchor B family protein [Rhodothermia bacterium]
MKTRIRAGLTVTLIFLFLAGSSFGQTRFSERLTAAAGFGGAIAVGEQGAFVGSAPVGWQTGDEPPGTVFLYTKNSDGYWVETAGIKANDGVVGDDFGRSVFLQGSTLVVGAPGVTAAYVFEEDDEGKWIQTGRLVPSSVGEGAEFGGAYARGGLRTGNIAIVGDRIVVTSYSADTKQGAVHVFFKTGESWDEEAILSPDEPAEQEGFAWTVASDGNQIFVGANEADEKKGAVYVFGKGVENWSQLDRFTSSDVSGPAGFGTTMAVQDGKLYVSAPAFETNGTVFVFEQADDSGSWSQSDRVSQSEPEDGSRASGGFGGGLAVSSENLLVGARGTVFVFQTADLMSTATQISAPDERSKRGFGVGLGIYGKVAVVGSPSADYDAGIATLFEKDEATGEWRPASTLASDLVYLDSISGDQIDCQDGTAGLFDCNNVDLVSFLSVSELATERGVKMTDLWGWEDPETGKEWVLQARTEGVAFVDISNPSYPIYVGQLLKTEGSPGAAWRDVKVYKDHAFIVADGSEAHGIQIFDLRQLRDVNPADMPVTLEETYHYSGVNSTHNIVINEETGFAYAVGNRAGGNTCGGQLHMINIQDPANPTFAGCYSFEPAGGTHDSQCVIYEGADTSYQGREICFNSNGSMFIIADVTDKDNPVTLATTEYPNRNYTHQGWLTEDHNYFFMNDELDEMNKAVLQTRTLIWDVQDLEDPSLVREFFQDSKASDHNLYIKGNFMYQSNYQAGLRILDISDPLNPVEVGRFDTAPYAEDAPGFGGSWSNYPYFRSGVIAVSSRNEGLFLLKKREVDL